MSNEKAAPAPGKKRWRWIIAGVVALGALAGGIGGVGAFAGILLVESTSTPEFCLACHEMEVFGAAWDESVHGRANQGAIAAGCVDCHLPDPEHGLVNYLFVKGKSGTKDIVCHLLGHYPDWIENLERREEYTYESGCLKCHVDLVAPEIPLKAITAHRDYELGQTEETCIGCHTDVGHGDLAARLEAAAH